MTGDNFLINSDLGNLYNGAIGLVTIEVDEKQN